MQYCIFRSTCFRLHKLHSTVCGLNFSLNFKIILFSWNWLYCRKQLIFSNYYNYISCEIVIIYGRVQNKNTHGFTTIIQSFHMTYVHYKSYSRQSDSPLEWQYYICVSPPFQIPSHTGKKCRLKARFCRSIVRFCRLTL